MRKDFAILFQENRIVFLKRKSHEWDIHPGSGFENCFNEDGAAGSAAGPPVAERKTEELLPPH